VRSTRRYGVWAGNPKGWPEDAARCITEVSDGWHFSQCGRKRGHGPDGLYCKQHAKRVEEKLARKANDDAR